jgi:hypothetical protein
LNRSAWKADRTGDRNPKVNITLSRTAWRMISDLSKHDRVTLSVFIEDRFEKERLSALASDRFRRILLCLLAAVSKCSKTADLKM